MQYIHTLQSISDKGTLSRTHSEFSLFSLHLSEKFSYIFEDFAGKTFFFAHMADIKKYSPSSGGNLFSDFKVQFSIFRTKRTFAIAYGFVFVFTAFTIFLAFSPSSNSSSPWFTNIFAVSSGGGGDAGPSSSSPTSFSIFSNESYRSRVSSIFSYFFPNSSSPLESHDFSRTDSAGSRNFSSLAPHSDKETPAAKTQTQNEEENHKVDALKPSVSETLQNFTTAPTKSSEGSLGIKNQTVNHHLGDKSEALNQNQTRAEASGGKVEVLKANRSSAEPPNSKNVTLISAKGSSEKGLIQNSTSSLMKKQNTSANAPSGKQGMDDLINSLMNCDLFDGNWVRDDSYPLYKPGSCSLIDEQFNCFLNGRPDNGYHKLKWKPRGCTLPRLNGGHMLETLRGKRLVFVGDSLNRNMWESLICILKNSVKDQKKVYEESGLLHFRGEASYAFIFEEYKCRVEFFVSPFLVQEWEVSSKDGTKKETLRLDMIGSSADKYKNADVIVFNTGHWWTHEKTSKGKDYYQEGSHVYSDLDVNEAFRKALTTWGRWVDANVNPMKSLVFFRGYSASHFSGGQWNSGGQCDHETDPIKNETYLTPYPPKMTVLEKVFKGMKIHVSYMNITRMTDYRKDGHPSIYRKQHLSEEERRSPLSFQDCSHWCLPGVPDAWNEILYSELLVRLNKFRQQQNRS